MTPARRTGVVAITLASFVGCGDAGAPVPAATAAKSTARPRPDVGTASEVGGSGTSPTAKEPPPDPKPTRPKPCELLPSGRVATVLEVPATELEEGVSAGCRYMWTSTDEEGAAILSDLFFGDSVEATQTRFGKLTRNPPEAKAPVGKANKPKGPRFTAVAGVGDEARLDHHTGKLFVRVGSVMFAISAYKSKRVQMPELSDDPKTLAAQMKQARADHVAQTLELRQKMGTTLAHAVIDALPE